MFIYLSRAAKSRKVYLGQDERVQWLRDATHIFTHDTYMERAGCIMRQLYLRAGDPYMSPPGGYHACIPNPTHPPLAVVDAVDLGNPVNGNRDIRGLKNLPRDLPPALFPFLDNPITIRTEPLDDLHEELFFKRSGERPRRQLLAQGS